MRMDSANTWQFLAGVFGILYLLMDAVYPSSPSWFTEMQVQSETKHIGEVINSVRSLYRGRYRGLTTQSANDRDLIPGGLMNLIGALFKVGPPLGHWGYVSLTPASLAGMEPETAFSIEMAGIPQSACAPFAAALLRGADEMELDVDGHSNVQYADVAKVCAFAPGGGTVKIAVRVH